VGILASLGSIVSKRLTTAYRTIPGPDQGQGPGLPGDAPVPRWCEAYEESLFLYAAQRRPKERNVTMCVLTMGLMVALAPAAIFFGLMIWKDGIGETPPQADVREPRRTMSLHQPASNTR
jgi:hypothetical protein